MAFWRAAEMHLFLKKDLHMKSWLTFCLSLHYTVKNAKADEPITVLFYKRFPKALCMILQSGIASVTLTWNPYLNS